MTTARAKQTTGLTNGRARNWAPEVEFSQSFSRDFPSSNDVPVLLLNQHIVIYSGHNVTFTVIVASTSGTPFCSHMILALRMLFKRDYRISIVLALSCGLAKNDSNTRRVDERTKSLFSKIY